jgi:beta-glucosidase
MSDIPLASKIGLTGGKDFWRTKAVPEASLPEVMMTDGPHGLRKQTASADHIGLGGSEPATCYPPAVGLSSTWSRETLEAVGRALGTEALVERVGIVLGPGANLKRSPLCGRNFEYFSEDPFVTGELAAALVTGVQSQGVGTSLKHFAANNQETDRMRRDSQVDQRTLRELYLRAFEKVVRRTQPWTVMCAYNTLNGTRVSENHWLLTELLRDEWGFEGFVVSDWGAVHDRVAAITAGLDLEMPANPSHDAALLTAYEAGQVDAATVETAYQRVEGVLHRVVEAQATAPDSYDAATHHAIARAAAERAVVLLSNDGVLPLATRASVAVVGEFARTPRYQGAGSSRVNPTRVENTLDAIAAIVGHAVPFAPGFTTSADQTLEPGAHEAAVAIAKDADVVLVFLGLGEAEESEGYDRTSLDLPAEQLALLDDVLAVNPNVVVVLSNGSSVLVPFAPRVRAVVEGWLLGQAGGPVLADVLYGLVNPSGKLTETIPHRLEDVPSFLHFPGDTTGVRYGEGMFVGYRGYDATHADVAFPFGHGLSYTTFAYRDIRAVADGNDITVEVTVTNSGRRTGREVVQMYLAKPDSRVTRAARELKGFADVTLEPGTSATVRVTIPSTETAYWSVRENAWLVESGEYLVEVGASSRDLRESATVALVGTEAAKRLTLASTMAEALAAPGFVERLGTMMPSASAMAAPEGGELGADMAKMVADFPLATMVGFVGLSEPAFVAMLDEVNTANGVL